MSATDDYREGYGAGYRRGQGEREALAAHNGDLASEVRDLTRQIQRLEGLVEQQRNYMATGELP